MSAEPSGGRAEPQPRDIEALTEALEVFTRTTQSLEAAHHALSARLREMDQELARKNRELALATEYLEGLLESISDGVIAVDTEGRITQFNRAASAILGHAADEVRGRSFAELFGRPFAAPAGYDAMALRAKGGRAIPVSERDSPVAGRGAQPMGHVKTFQDLSEIEAMRTRMRQVDRLAAIGEMAATVAHEIRNPLGGLRGFAALLARDIPESDPRRRLVDKILRGAESLDRVVNELLEYTRPIELRLEPVSCAALAAAAIACLEPGASADRVKNQADPDLHVLADPGKMRQVLLNVLLNALQSMDHPGGLARVWTEAAGGEAILHVEDSGCGMDPAQLEKIFSPFYTTKEKGTGLGLAVSLKIVEGHGGAMHARSAPGQGSTISIRLRRAH